MSEEVEQGSGAKAWEVVAAWIEQGIMDGRLVRGSTLPAERDLAAQLGVSRAVVREAVRTMQANGVLRSNVGAGAAGGTIVEGEPHVALTRILRMHVALANFPGRDVTEVRVVLERLSVASSCVHADDDAIAAMHAALERMDDDQLTPAEFSRYDTDFHVAIARSAGNRLATDLTVAIREAMDMPIGWGFNELPQWPRVRAQLRIHHRAILAAIEARSTDEAVELVDQHIWWAYEAIPRLHRAQ
ncbi:FadR/GntR family transcriptional regulator [Calidifontibacter indicus]|uniref:FadR/GntR family transcriptional regulator n=1 Tax=Calidifontibacter indicus TaxID=419650 RepID=UPI003D74A0F4